MKHAAEEMLLHLLPTETLTRVETEQDGDICISALTEQDGCLCAAACAAEAASVSFSSISTAAALDRFPGRFRYHRLFSDRYDCSYS